MMGKLVDLNGKKFGRWTVLELAHRDNSRTYCWLCECICGTKRVVKGTPLRNGTSQSCGCLTKDVARELKTTHGQWGTSTYWIWHSMIQRCYNKKSQHYNYYGNRGIKVCKKWLKFEGFFQDMGERPSELTLDRINNNGNYCKKNCRWTTRKKQQRNMRANINITIDGQTKSLVEWCEIFDLNYTKIHGRIYSCNWTYEEALEIVPRKRK